MLAAAGRAAEPTPADLHRTALQAFERADYPAAIQSLRSAIALRPGDPRFLYNLAIMHTRNEQPEQAIAALQQMTAFGVVLPVAGEEEFVPLRERPGFAAVVDALAAHRQPRGEAALLFELPDQSGIIEGLAHRVSTGEFFFGDVRQRCVWRRAKDGTLSRFTSVGDGLYGVFQLAVDEPRRRLWAATSMIPSAAGFNPADKGRAALVALDLITGDVIASFPLPPDGNNHVLGDLLLASDGTLFITDSATPTLWRLAPGATALDAFVATPGYTSLQGLALLDGGRKLLVSDYSNGLLAIDLSSRAITPVTSPANVTLLGLDGLLARDNAILAVQNGVEPQRVLRLALSPAADTVTSVETLAAGQPGFDDLTLLTVVAGHPVVIAQSGWASIDPADPSIFAAHPVRIFQLR